MCQEREFSSPSKSTLSHQALRETTRQGNSSLLSSPPFSPPQNGRRLRRRRGLEMFGRAEGGSNRPTRSGNFEATRLAATQDPRGAKSDTAGSPLSSPAVPLHYYYLPAQSEVRDLYLKKIPRQKSQRSKALQLVPNTKWAVDVKTLDSDYRPSSRSRSAFNSRRLKDSTRWMNSSLCATSGTFVFLGVRVA